MSVLKKGVKAGDKLVKLGEKIAADGKVDFNDAQYLPELGPIVMELYEVFKEKDQLVKDAVEFAKEKFEELKA